MTTLGIDENFYIADKLDSDGDLQMQIGGSDDCEAWITKDEAIKLIKHLKQVFELSDK